MKSVISQVIWPALALALLMPLIGHAQFNGHNTRGDFGLHSGTQAPPGLYLVPVIYDYQADTLRDKNGDERPLLASGGSVDVQAGMLGLLWTTETKIFGGNYGFEIWPGFTNNALEAPVFGASESASQAFADIYIRPITLGWNTARADFITGLGVFAPTGNWEPAGANNRGLGMWSYEIFGGTTVYFDDARTWHFATLASYETHGEKDGTNIRVGDLLTLEGGLGKSWMDGALDAGIIYYAQWKITEDELGAGIIRPNKHRVYGLGPEVTLAIASQKTLFGFLTMRYVWETGARSTLEGNTFMASLAFPLPSIPLQ